MSCSDQVARSICAALAACSSRFATTPSRYAKAVVTNHLLGDRAGAAAASPAPAPDELQLGTFLRQVRDELLGEGERQGKRLDALAARVSALAARAEALTAHVQALTARVQEVDQRLADFLTRVEPL